MMQKSVAVVDFTVNAPLHQTNTNTAPTGFVDFENDARRTFDETGTATTGGIFVANGADVTDPVLDGTFALSSASARLLVNSEVVQSDGNDVTGTDNDQGQIVEESNELEQRFDAETTATAGPVWVSSLGTYDVGGNGVNANSVANATPIVDSDVTQSNTNSGTGTNPLFLLQGQFVDQDNLNLERIDADTTATAGDVTVYRDGITTADLSGVNATSIAYAGSVLMTGVSSEIKQTNSSTGERNCADCHSGSDRSAVKPQWAICHGRI